MDNLLALFVFFGWIPIVILIPIIHSFQGRN